VYITFFLQFNENQMKRSILYFSGMLLVAFAAGCSSNVAPPPSVTYPQVTYVKGGTYVYYAQDLDKNTGQPSPGTGDTVTSVVLNADTTYQGMSNVVEIQNKHSNPGSGVDSVDMTYIAQSNGNYWHYNYGLEAINSNTTALLEVNTGNPIQAGWVLQAKLSAASGATWAALDTNIFITAGSLALADTATETSDSTFTIASAPDTTKHSVHSITALLASFKATLTVDTYMSATDGPVLDIFHPTTLNGIPAPGRRVQFLGKK
jgi:hypothetical protein